MKRIGKCKRCGNCCIGKKLYCDDPHLQMLMEQHGTDLICHHLIRGMPATCGIHKDKPELCRVYPEKPDDLLDDCGYKFERDG